MTEMPMFGSNSTLQRNKKRIWRENNEIFPPKRNHIEQNNCLKLKQSPDLCSMKVVGETVWNSELTNYTPQKRHLCSDAGSSTNHQETDNILEIDEGVRNQRWNKKITKINKHSHHLPSQKNSLKSRWSWQSMILSLKQWKRWLKHMQNQR